MPKLTLASEPPNPPGLPPTAADGRARLERAACALGAVGWLVVFAWLWAGLPWLSRLLGLGWAALGAIFPFGYLLSLAGALALFGNNPGGPHHLYLLEMGLIGLVAAHLARRAAGRRARRPARTDGWLALHAGWAVLCLYPAWAWLWGEANYSGRDFLFRIYNHYGTSYTYGLQMALKLLLGVGLVAVLRDLAPAPGRRAVLWAALLGVAAATALAGLGDQFGLLSLEGWRGVNPDIARFGYHRLQSLYWHSGWFALYLTAIAPAAAGLAVAGPTRAARAAGWAGMALFGLTMLLTFQRGGWLALGVGYGTVIAAGAATAGGGGRWAGAGLRAALVVLALAAAGGVLALAIPDFRQRAGALFAAEDRLLIWRSAWGVFLSDPLVGVGLGRYHASHLSLYTPGHPLALVDKVAPHNEYLYALSERGVIGLATLLLLLAAALRGAWAGVRAAAAGAGRWTALAVLGGLVGLAAYALVQELFYVRTVGLLVWLLIGMSTWPAAAGDPDAAPPATGLRPRPAVWALLLIAGASLSWLGHARIQGMPLISIPGGEFVIAGARARIELPPGANTFELRLASHHPHLSAAPVTFTVTYRGVPLRHVTFTDYTAQTVRVTLPPGRDPREPLMVHAASTWSPWAEGLAYLPQRQIGVLWSLLPAGGEPTAKGTER